MSNITHLDEQGRTRMVDVSQKAVSKRIAIAEGTVVFPPEVFEQIQNSHGCTAKGSIVEVAKIAGIMAAKNTANLIPMCHPMMIEKCDLSFEYQPDEYKLKIRSEVAITHKTGVEMEALTAVSVSALTVYDMTKALSHDIYITDIHLVQKIGGKSDFEPISNEMMTIKVLYFAELASITQKTSEEIQAPIGSTPEDIYFKLSERYHFNHMPSQLSVAINHTFSHWNDELHTGDLLAFITPVAGG